MTHLYEYEVYFDNDDDRDNEIVESTDPPSAAEESIFEQYPEATKFIYVGRVD
jgi:hypothetical protein